MNFKILKLRSPYFFAYLVISIFFITWMIFLDTHSLLVHLELNKEIVDKKKIKKIKLNTNDVIEVVHFIGGG